MWRSVHVWLILDDEVILHSDQAMQVMGKYSFSDELLTQGNEALIPDVQHVTVCARHG